MRRDRLLLAEIIEAAERIVDLVNELESVGIDAVRDKREALLWNFTVLGEATGQLSDELKAAQPEVAWNAPVRMRNRIGHGYWSIDLDVLLSTAQDDLDAFVAACRRALEQLSTDEPT